jgi:hypothetical protein
MPPPGAYTVALAIKAGFDSTGVCGEVVAAPGFIESENLRAYLDRCMGTSGEYRGVIIEPGPATRTGRGQKLTTVRQFLVSVWLSTYEGSETDFDEMVQAMVAWLALNDRLGFTDADVRHENLQEPQGQPRWQHPLLLAHNLPGVLPVTVKGC